MFDKEEAAISRELGFARLWDVENNYEITEGVLKPFREGKERRMYFPMAHLELPNAIYKLNPDNHNDLLNFAKMYGNFGHYALVEPNNRQGGDPLQWIKAHVEGVRLVLDLSETIQENNEGEAAIILDSISPEENKPPQGLWGDRGSVKTSQWFLGPASKGTALELSKSIVRGIIGKNIQGIYRKPFKGENDSIVSYFSFHAMIEAVYWQILDTIEAGKFKRCEYCNKPFLKTDNRQKFCPHNPDFEKESRCAIAYRQKKYREKQKQKGEK